MALPRKPNRQSSQNFADIIGRRAQEIRAQPHGQEILQMQSPEQIAEFMSPMMMGVGNLTNITGRGLPQILSQVTKSQAQRTPAAANFFENVLGRKSPPNFFSKEIMKIAPMKMNNFNKRLSRWNIKLRPAEEKGKNVLEIVTTDPRVIQGRYQTKFGRLFSSPESVQGKELVMGTIEKGKRGYWVNDAFGYSEIGKYLSTDVLEKAGASGRKVNLRGNTLEELLDKLTKNLM